MVFLARHSKQKQINYNCRVVTYSLVCITVMSHFNPDLLQANTIAPCAQTMSQALVLPPEGGGARANVKEAIANANPLQHDMVA